MNTYLATKNYSSVFFLERILWKKMWVVIKHITFFFIKWNETSFLSSSNKFRKPWKAQITPFNGFVVKEIYRSRIDLQAMAAALSVY